MLKRYGSIVFEESTRRKEGEILGKLASQLADDESGIVIIVQNHKADRFFNRAQSKLGNNGLNLDLSFELTSSILCADLCANWLKLIQISHF